MFAPENTAAQDNTAADLVNFNSAGTYALPTVQLLERMGDPSRLERSLDRQVRNNVRAALASGALHGDCCGPLACGA